MVNNTYFDSIRFVDELDAIVNRYSGSNIGLFELSLNDFPAIVRNHGTSLSQSFIEELKSLESSSCGEITRKYTSMVLKGICDVESLTKDDDLKNHIRMKYKNVFSRLSDDLVYICEFDHEDSTKRIYALFERFVCVSSDNSIDALLDLSLDDDEKEFTIVPIAEVDPILANILLYVFQNEQFNATFARNGNDLSRAT